MPCESGGAVAGVNGTLQTEKLAGLAVSDDDEDERFSDVPDSDEENAGEKESTERKPIGNSWIHRENFIRKLPLSDSGKRGVYRLIF